MTWQMWACGCTEQRRVPHERKGGAQISAFTDGVPEAVEVAERCSAEPGRVHYLLDGGRVEVRDVGGRPKATRPR